MTADRPFVGGGNVKEMPGTCPACTWGRGPHLLGCQKMAKIANDAVLDDMRRNSTFWAGIAWLRNAGY